MEKCVCVIKCSQSYKGDPAICHTMDWSICHVYKRNKGTQNQKYCMVSLIPDKSGQVHRDGEWKVNAMRCERTGEKYFKRCKVTSM